VMSLVVPPYPPPRYTKDEPEVSAWLKRAESPPDYESPGVRYHYLANQEATGGDYGLYRVDIAPAAGGPGPHYHRAMSEAFFVLSGAMKLYDGTDWVDGHRATSCTSRPEASTASATRSTSRRRS
jgi:mannose-6-phosphate isomerase-like protein (cupin superfamily)